jgi:NAD(P)-dependent dehydrogenase (short-subunit alcohol dehydrogenase family)
MLCAMMQTLLMVGVKHLGRDIALRFAKEGWRVLCASRTREDVEALARDVGAAGGTGVPVICDITRPETLTFVKNERIDLCVAAQSPGGRFGAMPLLEIADEELTRALTVSVQGTWNLLKAVGAKLVAQRAGTFLQMGTSSGLRTREGFGALGASQFALRALVQVAAREWRPHGVHAAYVAIDGPIASERTASWNLPEGKTLDPLEIAEACAYLHGQRERAWTHELVLRPRESEWTVPT